MIHTLDEKEFIALQLERCAVVAGVRETCSAALASFARKFLPQMTGGEVVLLFALLHLTVGSGRVARMMSLKELETGLREGDEVEFHGTGLHENTIRNTLNSLARRDFIHVYREERRGKYEGSARIFEINFKAFDLGFSRNLLKIWAENVGTPSQKMYPSTYVYKGSDFVTESSTEVASYYSLASRAGETQQGETDVYVGKKDRPVFASRPPGTAAAVAAAVIDKSRAKTSARAATAAKTLPGGITRDGMQAMFDKLYPQCGVQHRLMVTVKEFGYLRKSMTKNPPGDLEAMLRFSLTYWPMLSQQNSRAVSKDGEKLVRAKSLPPAPHFNTFAYWYPYFLRAYQNHLAGRNSETMKDAGDRKVAQIENELERTRGMVTMLRRQNTALRAASAPAAPLQSISKPAVVRRRPVAADTELPAWE